MNSDSTDPREIAAEALAAEDADDDDFDDDEDLDEDDETEPLDDNEIRERPASRDPDEVEADGLLQLDRKELNELGLELDNPDGFADE
jgi:hypothetical protein